MNHDWNFQIFYVRILKYSHFIFDIDGDGRTSMSTSCLDGKVTHALKCARTFRCYQLEQPRFSALH
jgi:hypothetical protein